MSWRYWNAAGTKTAWPAATPLPAGADLFKSEFINQFVYAASERWHVAGTGGALVQDDGPVILCESTTSYPVEVGADVQAAAFWNRLGDLINGIAAQFVGNDLRVATMNVGDQIDPAYFYQMRAVLDACVTTERAETVFNPDIVTLFGPYPIGGVRAWRAGYAELRGEVLTPLHYYTTAYEGALAGMVDQFKVDNFAIPLGGRAVNIQGYFNAGFGWTVSAYWHDWKVNFTGSTNYAFRRDAACLSTAPEQPDRTWSFTAGEVLAYGVNVGSSLEPLSMPDPVEVADGILDGEIIEDGTVYFSLTVTIRATWSFRY